MKNILKLIIFIIMLIPNLVIASTICNKCLYYPTLDCGKKSELIVVLKVGINDENVVVYDWNKNIDVNNSCKTADFHPLTVNISVNAKAINFKESCPSLFYFLDDKKVYTKENLGMDMSRLQTLISSGDVHALTGQQLMNSTCAENIKKLQEEVNQKNIERTCSYKSNNSTLIIELKNGTLSANPRGIFKNTSADDFKNACPNYIYKTVQTSMQAQSNYSVKSSSGAEKYTLTSLNQASDDNNGLSGASPYEEPKDCEGVLGSPETVGEPAYYLQTAFDVIKYIALVALVILTVADIAKTIMSENKDMSKELTRKLFLRLIYAICIFFVPIIVNIIMKVTGAYDSCNIS